MCVTRLRDSHSARMPGSEGACPSAPGAPSPAGSSTSAPILAFASTNLGWPSDWSGSLVSQDYLLPGLGARWALACAACSFGPGRDSRHSNPVFPLSRHGPAKSSPTAGNADRAVPVDFRRFPAVIRASCAPPVRRGRPPKARPKKSTTIRLSQDVIDHFRAGGRGWQTRIDQALRDWIKQHDVA